MSMRRAAIIFSGLFVSILVLLLPVNLGLLEVHAAQGPSDRSQSGFLGAWCAQGDPGKQCSISSNGAFLTLRNENGDTSPGNLRGGNSIQAPGWQFVTGRLSQDGSQINWSNGTFWARCYGGGGGAGWDRPPNLTGTWFAGGNRSNVCSIQQRGRRLRLNNESGQSAQGNFDSRRHITTVWNGATIGGTISRDGGRIDWDNGSYWIRNRLMRSGP